MQSGGKCAVSMACRYISWSLVLAFVGVSGVSGVPEAAAAVGRVDRVPAAVRLSVSAPVRIAPGGTVLLTGRVSPSSAKLVLQRQYRGRWVSSGRLVSRTRNGRFVLAVRAPTTGGTLRIRLLGLRAGHRIASIVKRVAVRRRAPTSAGPTTSATVVSPSTVKSVPPAGDPGTVVLDGDQSPTPGSVLASSVGPNTPSGFLGKVVSVSHASGKTIIHTKPTTIEEAIPAGTFNLDDATPIGAQTQNASAARSTAARSAAADGEDSFSHRLDKAFSCEGGASFSATGDAQISATPHLSVSWSPFHGVSASFTETVNASASLSGLLSTAASCTLDKTALLAHPAPLGTFAGDVLGLPVVVVLQGQIYINGSATAQGGVSAGIQGHASASGGIAYSHGRASVVSPRATLTYSPQGPSAQASGSLGAHVTPELQVLLYGAGGPVFDATTGLDFNADTTQNPWWRLTAPLKVTASLAAPDFDLSTPALTLYSHTFTIAHAPGAFGPVGAPPTTPTTPTAPTHAPAAGTTLIYQGDTAGGSTVGDLSFDDWSAANGEPVDYADTLPSDVSAYRCVVLDLNETFAAGDQAALTGYLAQGGTVLALGEHGDSGGGFDASDAAINGLAAALGSQISLDDDAIDGGDTVTSSIDSSPLSSGVFSLGYNWSSSLSVASSAQPLVESADDFSTLIAAQAIDGGTFVISGDSNFFSDNNDGFYANDDNGRLVEDLCP
jgi:hypothetical protein